jgi:excisionase family DNA binding protein
MADGDLLTIPEGAMLLRLKVSTIRAWVLQRKLPHVKLGRRVFLRRSDIESLISVSVVPARSNAVCGEISRRQAGGLTTMSRCRLVANGSIRPSR